MNDVLIITGKGAAAAVFARMLQLEAAAAGLKAEIVRALPASIKNRLILCDIDSFAGADALQARPDTDKAHIVCFSSARSEYGGMTLLKRPFEIEQLRKILYETKECDSRLQGGDDGQAEAGVKPDGATDAWQYLPAGGTALKAAVGEPVISLDARAKTATVGGITVTLTPYEYTVMSLLVERRGEPVSCEVLSNAVSGRTVNSNIISVYMRHLRRKIDEELDIKLIRTVRNKGYMIK